MPISVTPTIPVITASSAAPELVLQPGTVVDAQVLQILSAELVRIAINSLSIDVLSEVPLQAGQSLQLAVSQTPDGVRLAVVGQGAAAAASPDSVGSTSGATLAPGAALASGATSSAVNAPADAVASPSVVAAAPLSNVLTPLQRVAVSVATETAATQQGSLAPLFANLGVVAASGQLPPALQQAVAQVLAQQTTLDQNLTGDDVKNAFQTSGLFLEASLASGSVSSAAGIPDLKAALIVLRQTIAASLGTVSAAEEPTAPATIIPQPASAPAPTLAPSLSPEIDAQEILLPQARVAIADDAVELDSIGRIVLSALPLQAEPSAATIGAVLNLLQEALQGNPRQTDNTALASAMPKDDPANDNVTVHTNTPPPPFRGSLPSAQPVAAPSIASSAPLATSAHQLLDNTDAAIARQTLLQVASLPDRVTIADALIDPAAPRWSFEIPFVTPQGTAVTQFEISRDGGGSEVEAAKRVWRARFSLDIEPAGPVHALVSLSGDRTSVRMWAERPATAAQLRAGAAQLSQALNKAELKSGDIVIRDGAPPQAAPAPAGHFLDRAL
jgi:Flagellar hook-length control protein FliK